MNGPGGVRRAGDPTPETPHPGPRSSQNSELRAIPATDQAIRSAPPGRTLAVGVTLHAPVRARAEEDR